MRGRGIVFELSLRLTQRRMLVNQELTARSRLAQNIATG
ncbi:hypothetical protein BRCON_1449 [Candidatus Sumerlaea chitinivorans]|uniref:Uncharacterized protein n=1 Tax=Sumerlaea chitinivorans TaxID=2250252 RepID=A0A2Z4Y5K2_SUMC1|nr:hypothetical protein BRCON_1449 [Candidatus Sumerlaea chitinivorans]